MRSLAIAGAVALALGSAACNRPSAHTDATITAEVRKQLSDDHVPGSFDVTTSKGVVTLAGTVPDKTAKNRAQDVADDVKGVDRVVNDLRITLAGDAPAQPRGLVPPVGVPPVRPEEGAKP